MEKSHQGPELSSTYDKIRITGVLVIKSLLYWFQHCYVTYGINPILTILILHRIQIVHRIQTIFIICHFVFHNRPIHIHLMLK